MSTFETALEWEGRKLKNRCLIKVKDKRREGVGKNQKDKCPIEREKSEIINRRWR